jgi:alkanesulfonate monooxygenase SsuD/methylene tetrahydromethanopterin reductase-like flavin-dependent oxidoreductase (luciferase family)
LLVGTTGEQAIRVAAQLADGVLLPEGAGPDAVAWVRDLLPPAATIGLYAWLRVDEDGERARECLVPTVRRWRDGGLYPRLVEHGAIPPTVGSADVARVAIAGTPSECAGAVRQLARAGATTLMVMPVGEDRIDQVERFAREVMPLCQT